MTTQMVDQRQLDLFQERLFDQLDPKDPLVILSKAIPWGALAKKFQVFYHKQGRNAKAIRLMIAVHLLKYMYKLSDKDVELRWKGKLYWQYFSGYNTFQKQVPFTESDICRFRKRIGQSGAEMIFQASVAMHGLRGKEQVAVSDTTVQGNNITYPTDAKLAQKVAELVVRLAKTHGIRLRHIYKNTRKYLLITACRRFKKSGMTKTEATVELRRTAGVMLSELERKLKRRKLDAAGSDATLYDVYVDLLMLSWRVLEQKREDKNKIYSLFKRYTACIMKGKAHARYEFGNKVGIMVGSKRMVITAVKVFEGNPNDGKTIEPLLEQCKALHSYEPKEVLYDRGGRGVAKVGNTIITIPGKPKKEDSYYRKSSMRKKFRRRAAIEAIISHLKLDYRMAVNYFKTFISANMNALLACTAWNLMKYVAHTAKAA